MKDEGEKGIIREGGEREYEGGENENNNNKIDNEPEENGQVAAPKWDQLDDMGLPVIDKAKDPETWKEVELVRGLVKQERSHG